MEEEIYLSKKESALPSVIGCLIVQLCVGILYLWSVFRSPIIAPFSMESGAARMISSYMLFAFVIGILLGGYLNDKKGPKITATLGIVMFSLGIFLSGLLTSETINLLNLTYCVSAALAPDLPIMPASAACKNGCPIAAASRPDSPSRPSVFRPWSSRRSPTG
jgi:MFS family permease